jgi:superfamily II DNA or RNA helicase
MRKYRDVYSEGIINNKQRNRLIAKEINDQNKQGKSVLVMVVDVVNGHAEQIATIAKEVYGIKTEIVKGATQSDLREGIKGRLERKESLAVIATVVWREGINIKSLDCVINACGGKSEIVTLQAIGRGLRTTEGKTDLTVVDFLDPYDYLAQHTIQRISIYAKNGWIS